ncbi:hypothetical protein ACI2K4_28500 [Micromonospora sp. NPDC050397]|uniref:hypothetical protein n=1 Tax=Micromonospora sp. NPDC050397 TaxID=3364279 RepID=UPI00384A71F3
MAGGEAIDTAVAPDQPEFAATLDRARELVRRGDAETAWEVVAEAVPRWHSDDPLSIAPLALLTDPVLNTLVTPQRATWIATTPRGGY